jgi:hypothetical protein
MHSILLDQMIVGTGSSNLAYPNFVSLISGTHHVWAHMSVTQIQKKSGLQSQRIRLHDSDDDLASC